MCHVADKFYAAVRTLTTDAPLKQRLIGAYVDHLETLSEDDLPEALRTRFESLRAAMHAVPPTEKEAARGHVGRWLADAHPVIVRVNAFGTDWFAGDLDLCRGPGVAGVMLPKAEHEDQIAAVQARLGRSVPVLPIVETALGVWHAEAVARSPQVERLVFGALDLALDLQVSGDEALSAYRALIVLVSRVVGLPAPVDVPTTTFTDPDRVRADAVRARQMGFGGKLCIHPAQVAPVHEAFAPTEDEVAWARRVLAADVASGGAATSLDGEMVDRPVVARAHAILARLA